MYVTINADGVFINDAKVTVGLVATNGVVHVIDAVLLPPAQQYCC
ncbi:MAG: fasciclin domain-containing protein [Saprospiraceae bacterium]|nr:fasciclin domain-containing protein [Saprospiraceae bacterium]